MPLNNDIRIDQSVAVLIDGNNIEKSIHDMLGTTNAMIDFDTFIPKIIGDRALSRLMYFREGRNISKKLSERLREHFHGSVVPCHKSADIPLAINAIQVSQKVDTIIILSGDQDYVELVRHLQFDGIRVEIASVERTTAAILKDEAEHFTAIRSDDCFTLKKSNETSKEKEKKRSTGKKTPEKGIKRS